MGNICYYKTKAKNEYHPFIVSPKRCYFVRIIWARKCVGVHISNF